LEAKRYDTIWVIGIVLAMNTVLIHMPIKEAPLALKVQAAQPNSMTSIQLRSPPRHGPHQSQDQRSKCEHKR